MLTAVEPNQISSRGGESVKLFGAFGLLSEHPTAVYVQFGYSEPVVAGIIDDTEIVCTAPRPPPRNSPFADVGGYFVLVRVTNRVDIWSNPVQLFVHTPLEVFSIFPDAGPSCGGTHVSIVGRNFVPSASMVCVFGESHESISIDATWRSSDLVECTTPSWSLQGGQDDAVTPIVLSTGGRESNGPPNLFFRFVAPITVSTISPEMGPATRGTKLTIYGEMLGGYEVTCKVAHHDVSPVVLDDTRLQCMIPPRSRAPNRSFQLKVVKSIDSANAFDYQVMDEDVTTVKEKFEYTDAVWKILEPGAIVLPLVRGHQYWFDQSDESNFGNPIAFSREPRGGHNSSGSLWTKGVERILVSAGSSAPRDARANRTGAGVLSFQVPFDAPEMLYVFSEASSDLERSIILMIMEETVLTSVMVIATFGSFCDPAAHPFR